MTKDLDDQSRVRLSLPQFWSIMVAVALAGFVVASELGDIKARQVDARNEFTLARQIGDARSDALTRTLRELIDSRAEAQREWAVWRASVDRTNQRQDGEIATLKDRK